MTYAVWQLLPYLLVLAGGNIIATALVPVLVPEHVETGWLDPLPRRIRPLLYAFLGVFAFRGILANLSYNALGANLSFGGWIARARDSAVAAVLAKQVRKENESHQRRTRGLRELTETELNANIAQLLGDDAVAQLEVEARQSNTDPKLYKALHLAKEKPGEVDAILKAANERDDSSAG
jgi:hypothetical protein